MTRPIPRCGTPSAAVRHYRIGEKPCEPCRLAMNKHCLPYNRARHRAQRELVRQHPERFAKIESAMRAELGLPPVRKGSGLSKGEYERLRNKVRDRARARLVKAYPAQYRRLLNAEQARSAEGQTAGKGASR